MQFQEYLYDLFFEISSQERHKVLLNLREETSNLTRLSNKIELNLPETRRHISRLLEVDLIERNPEGSYSLTNYGYQILELIEEISFYTKHKEYFLTHPVQNIPREFRIRFRDISECEFDDNLLNFIRKIEHVIIEAQKELYLLVDQFPLNFLSIILDAIGRGVEIKIIEPQIRNLNPDLEALAPSESVALEKMKFTPLVEQRMIDEVNILLIVSEKQGVVSFPDLNNEFDYKGFISIDKKSLEWCKDLFNYHWKKALERKVPQSKIPLSEENQIENINKKSISIIGQERPEYDVKSIQDAVDRYDEVILKGRFNLGSSDIIIKKSVEIKGDGRTNNIPDTKIYKKGWNFPFVSQEFLFIIRGDNIDVTIENIHIENFNGTCIGCFSGNSIKILKNRITLISGLGRGLSMGKWGDHIVGLTVGGRETINNSFPGGALIEDNFLDFALSYSRGGFISSDNSEYDPEYRPDLQNHEYFITIGMNICRNSGKVIVKNNIIKNMSARGILVFDNWDNSEIIIENNIVTSEVFGAYPYNNPMSGVGIFIMSAWSEPRKGAKVQVSGNNIIGEKVNYCGIAIHGPAIYSKGAGKLDKCIIEKNEITIKNGLYGIQIRKSDNTIIRDNKIRGKVYYCLQVNGSKSRENIELGSNNNIFINNNIDDLIIKPSDKFSDNHVDGYIFYGQDGISETAHIWLNNYTKTNLIRIKPNNTYIDKGILNKIELVA